MSPQTRHLIGAAELACMKETAYLVNVARGGVVDHDALVDALQRNLIAGAIMDVTNRSRCHATIPCCGSTTA